MKYFWDKISKTWYYYRVKPVLEIKKWLHNKKGKILVIGCGTGRNLKEIIKHGDVYAIDISDKMIDFAKKDFPDVNYKVALQESLPFKDNYFDYVISWSVLHHSTDFLKSIKEIKRVLKKKGKALISVWKQKNNYGWKCIFWNAKNESIPRLIYFFNVKEIESIFKKVKIKFKRIFLNSKNLIYELEK